MLLVVRLTHVYIMPGWALLHQKQEPSCIYVNNVGLWNVIIIKYQITSREHTMCSGSLNSGWVWYSGTPLNGHN